MPDINKTVVIISHLIIKSLPYINLNISEWYQVLFTSTWLLITVLIVLVAMQDISIVFYLEVTYLLFIFFSELY